MPPGVHPCRSLTCPARRWSSGAASWPTIPTGCTSSTPHAATPASASASGSGTSRHAARRRRRPALHARPRWGGGSMWQLGSCRGAPADLLTFGCCRAVPPTPCRLSLAAYRWAWCGTYSLCTPSRRASVLRRRCATRPRGSRCVFIWWWQRALTDDCWSELSAQTGNDDWPKRPEPQPACRRSLPCPATVPGRCLLGGTWCWRRAR